MGIQGEISVGFQFGGAKFLAKRREKLSGQPVSDLKALSFDKTQPYLVVERSRTQLVRHLDQTVSAGMHHAANLAQGDSDVFLGQVLQHAVGKCLVKNSVAKGKIASVAHDKERIQTELCGDVASRAHSAERGIDADRAVAGAGGRDAPPAPVAAHLHKEASVAGRQVQVWDRILPQLSLQVRVEPAIGGRDPLIDPGVDLVLCRGWHQQRRFRLRGGEGALRVAMGEGYFLNNEDGNAIDHAVGMALFADELAAGFAQGSPVARAHNELQKSRIDPAVTRTHVPTLSSETLIILEVSGSAFRTHRAGRATFPFMHILLNAFAASSGSGLTYVRNVAPVLARRSDLRATFLVGSELGQEFGQWPNVEFKSVPEHGSVARRFLWEQSAIPRMARALQADVLVSSGNFAIRKSPIPQILLSGNSLYTSLDYRRDLRSRGEYGLGLDNEIRAWFAARSVGWADCTVAPSEAFARELRQWTGKAGVVAIHHGFDRDVFFADDSPLPEPMLNGLRASEQCLRLLYVSHYNYFRNFEMLFRGLSILRAMLPEKNPKLLLTTRLRSAENPGDFRAEPAAALVRELGLSEHVVEMGAIPYRHLHHLYRACNLYVTPSYAETFAHPVVEAMACGVPVVASDLAVHREVAGDAAVYFPRFSPEILAQQVRDVVQSPELAQQLSRNGEQRSADFSWNKHVDRLLAVARDLQRQVPGRPK